MKPLVLPGFGSDKHHDRLLRLLGMVGLAQSMLMPFFASLPASCARAPGLVSEFKLFRRAGWLSMSVLDPLVYQPTQTMTAFR